MHLVGFIIRIYQHARSPERQISEYEGVSKSPTTMLITRKSLVVHEFPARVCCGGVL